MTISVHGHDDLGMAVANFMSAIEGGARQVRNAFLWHVARVVGVL